MKRLWLSIVVATSAAAAAEWSEPVHVLHEHTPCVTYRAKVDGHFLVVEAVLQPGWHTFAIDNERRAAEKLAGKKSLGIDQPTQITVAKGFEVTGPWYQTPPLDLSKPELRWFSFGFEKQALFVARVQGSAASKPAEIGIRGQACTDKTCKNIDVTLSVPATKSSGSSQPVDLSRLVQVR